MDPQTSKLYCSWAANGLALHNSGGALLCCHSRTFLKDSQEQQIFWHTHSLEDAWASPTRKQIIDALHQGEQHPNCDACWSVENTGGTSRRQHTIGRVEVTKDNEDLPLLLDLKLGNICNLSCRTCNPMVSSRWYRDWWEVIDRHKSHFADYNQYLDAMYLTGKLSYSPDNVQLWETLDRWFRHVQYVDIYGAEPMMIDRLFDILNNSINSGLAKDQVLHFNTNATIWDDSKISTLSQFKQIYIDLSIDGLYKHYDYLRYGKTWEEVKPNLDKYYQFQKSYPHHCVSICVTVSITNMFYLDEIWDYFARDGWLVHFNLAHLPNHVNLKCIPKHAKETIKNKLLSSNDKNFIEKVSSIISYMMDDQEWPSQHWKEFVRVTQELDIRRNQDFAEFFPEFYSVIKEDFRLE